MAQLQRLIELGEEQLIELKRIGRAAHGGVAALK